ncbi:hypothetical protein SAMN04490248_12224 [Salinihabitans flavidus]|uniref:CAAX prenyl protease 2/Lysostaphin resistance protein A-like domain-containing protein n=1 Tax=Salinihabitans flavidus TaxID=569882 RepID=A0A1H8UTQ0_9RHOB|nr:CPBP family intramembrane glutamic endopeptidase [Salinihabitans flavidus]SEP06383.1 hypothetical protein SAMN04490248_12224 [Salinihabitans flavidus]
MYRYHGQSQLADPARASAEPWRLGLGLLLVWLGYVALVSLVFQGLRELPDGEAILREAVEGSTPRGALTMLLSFVALIVALRIVLGALHRRGLRSLTGPPGMVWRDFRRVLMWFSGLLLVAMLIPGGESMNPSPNLPPGRWLLLLPVSLLAVVIQTGAEELIFRGYAQSQLAARFRSPLIWMGLPSVLFGALHFDVATYGENAPIVAGGAALFGLAAADLTARAGNLGPALALHFGNNVMALLLIAMDGAFSGLALFTLPFGPQDGAALRSALLVDGTFLFCTWLAARIAIRR